MRIKIRYHFTNQDKIVIGPRLYCEHCGQKKVLSPCYSCKNPLDEFPLNKKQFCRGCGFLTCKKEYEICNLLEQCNSYLK